MTKVLLIDPAKPGRKDAPINELDHYVSILEQKIRNHLFGHFIKEEYDQRGIKDTYQDYPYIANLGLLMIGTVAKNAGHEVYYYQFTEQEDKSELDELISKSEVIGITAMNTTVDDAIDIAKRSKRINPNSQVVGGGPEFSNSKVNYMLNNPYFDVLFRGESEITFVQFLNDPKKISNLKRIKGINYRENKEVIINRENDLVDVTQLPAPDFTLVPRLDKSQIYLETSRGCLQKCSFCMEHISNVRFKTEYQMIKELEVIEKVRTNSLLHIIDSDFAVSKRFLDHFIRAVQQSNSSNHFNIQTRIDGINAEKIKQLYSNHVIMINFGLDNLSNKVLEKVQKRLTWENIIAGLSIAAEYAPNQFLYRGNFIQGLPGETTEEANLNVSRRREILDRNLLLRFRDYIFMPVSGSSIYADPKKFGIDFREGTSSFRNNIPKYRYANPFFRSGDEIYLHHLTMRTVVNDFFISEYDLHGLRDEAMETLRLNKN